MATVAKDEVLVLGSSRVIMGEGVDMEGSQSHWTEARVVDGSSLQ